MKMLKHFSKLVIGLSTLSLVAMGQVSRADAASVTFSGTGTNSVSGGATNALGASVLFDNLINPGKLTITLTNTGPGASVPSDVLTAFFWEYNGTPLTNLSLFSAIAPKVTSNNGNTITNNVNLKAINEWKLPNTGNGTSDLPGITQNYGIGTAGLGIFQGGGGQQMNYGIISGYDSANPAVKNGNFVKDSATFVLSDLPSGFDIGKISNVRFQYGTNLSEPSFAATTVNYSGYTPPKPPPSTGGGGPRKIPEPTTTLALGVAAISALKLRKSNSVAQA